MTQPLRIAFAHKARSGKDTAVGWFINKFGGVNSKFTASLYGCMFAVQDYLKIPYEKDTLFLQVIGTQWGRAKDPNFWTKRVKIPVDQNCFISDCRFKNEAQFLREQGFILVKINRDLKYRLPLDRDPNHPSEIDLDDWNDWDYVINNNGTLEDYYIKLRQLADDISAKRS